MPVDATTLLGTERYDGLDLRSPLRHEESKPRTRRPRLSPTRSAAGRAEYPPALPPPTTVLLIDRDERSRRRLQALLGAEGFRTHAVRTLHEALAWLEGTRPDLVLLDPGRGSGSDGAEALRRDPRFAGIPVMLVLARQEGRTRLGDILAGAQEFIRRPVNRHVLALRIRNLVELTRLRAMPGRPHEALEQAARQRNSELERFRSAMEGAADAIFLIDRRSMRFVEVNQTASKLLGYSREELFEAGPGLLWPGTTQQLEDDFDAIIAADIETGPVDTRMRHKLGGLVDVEIHQQAQRWGEDWLVVGIVRDITERKQAEESLHHLAHYDALTGLPNRAQFYATLKRTVAQATSHGWGVAVLFIDLDNFKSVNDTLGHAIGDELLSQLGNRLVKCVRTRDVIGRLGGDEFALILVMNDCRSGAALVAAKVRAALQAPFRLMGHDVLVTASIGITIHPDDTQDATTLLRYADMAMYRAKQAGRDATCFFTAQMNVDLLARMALEAALRAAVDNGEFVLHYQPKMSLGTEHITGVEALLRWQRPGHGLVAPQAFVTVLEDTGLIVAVGRSVIRAACRQISQWLQSSVGPVQVAVNISARQFIDGTLAQDVRDALDESGIPAHLLELELTESSLMENTDRTVGTLTRLKAMGIAITIDDFGTGYSSLAYLRRFPIDKLKIDIAFIRDITTRPDDATLALAIITMAHSLKLTVIAEGVETMEQLSYLRRHRCDQIQGYLFSRPLPAPEMEWMLLDRGRAPTALEAALRLQFPPHAD